MLLAKKDYTNRNGLFRYALIKCDSADVIIQTIREYQKKTLSEDANFIVCYVPKDCLDEMETPRGYEEFDSFTDRVFKLAVPIIGFAGDNPKKPEKEINISSEKSRINGRFLISPDGNIITYESLYRFDNERDAYVYTYANDVYYTDRTMSEIMEPILNNAHQFFIFDFVKHEKKPISKEEMMMIYYKMTGKMESKDFKAFETQ